MSLVFAETVRKAISHIVSDNLIPIDDVECIAVICSICQLGFERFYREFDFPENWLNDPQAFDLFMTFTISLFVEMSPKPDDLRQKLPELLNQALENHRNPPPQVEPTTNRGREMARRREVAIKYPFKDSRSYNPKKWGRVRKFTEDEMCMFLDKSAQRAAKAFQQWRLGVPLEQIDG